MTQRGALLDSFADAEDRLDRRVSVRSWAAFPVELAAGADGALLLCERADKPLRYVGYRAGMFERFLLLADKDDQAVVAFANQFGRLGLCRHGMPSTLAGSCQELRATATGFRGFMAERT